MRKMVQVLAVVFAILAGYAAPRPSLEQELNGLMAQGYRIFDPEGHEIDRFVD
jgi:hypothetical protein